MNKSSDLGFVHDWPQIKWLNRNIHQILVWLNTCKEKMALSMTRNKIQQHFNNTSTTQQQPPLSEYAYPHLRPDTHAYTVQYVAPVPQCRSGQNRVVATWSVITVSHDEEAMPNQTLALLQPAFSC